MGGARKAPEKRPKRAERAAHASGRRPRHGGGIGRRPLLHQMPPRRISQRDARPLCGNPEDADADGHIAP
eukprot:9486913-Pyramimonas_sp.AAC.1